MENLNKTTGQINFIVFLSWHYQNLKINAENEGFMTFMVYVYIIRVETANLVVTDEVETQVYKYTQNFPKTVKQTPTFTRVIGWKWPRPKDGCSIMTH